MAIARYTITCDWCAAVDTDLESDGEATEDGWFLVKAPERVTGGNGEVAFCSKECLNTYFE